MSTLNRKQLKKLLLKEFRMMGMAPMGAVGDAPLGMSTSHGHHDYEKPAVHHDAHKSGHEGSVSKEDCCKAVLCLIACCECPETKALLRECCEDILSRC